MGTKSEKKKSYFAPSSLAVKFAKAMESAGATPEEINGMSENGAFLKGVLENYRGVLLLFDPHKFFVTREGLWVSPDFRDRILSVAKKKVKVSSSGEGHFDLPVRMNDAEIQKKLGEGHIYEDASRFCSVLAGMIDRQPNGGEGILITNGYANIFYVRGKNNEVFTVRVGWYSGGHRWYVYAHQLNDDQWDAGCRAFSRNKLLMK